MMRNYFGASAWLSAAACVFVFGCSTNESPSTVAATNDSAGASVSGGATSGGGAMSAVAGANNSGGGVLPNGGGNNPTTNGGSPPTNPGGGAGATTPEMGGGPADPMGAGGMAPSGGVGGEVGAPDPGNGIGLYKTFERSIENAKAYSNRFSGVQLDSEFTSPSGKTTKFFGFFDGDGKGGGSMTQGNVWKIRFIPDEVGEWKYSWTWSDGSPGGSDVFNCTKTGAGKGILRPYKANPRWLAYNGTEPVWLKSYYESGHGSIAQPLDWLAKNVYQPMIDRGYNHFQVNWLLSLCCFSQYYHDGPAPSSNDLTLYSQGKASSTMRFDVWEMMERTVSWLNDRSVGLHMFLGFDGSRNSGPAFKSLSADEKDFYVRYVVARLAPYANIAGWSYVWEVPGDRENEELGWARLVMKYDVFNHLRTYQDEHPSSNEYKRPEYNFAAIENHGIASSNRDDDRPHWREAWTHHEACKVGYVEGKPVYMIEGNALWRRYWAKKTGANQDDLRQSAWGCATASASFNWAGHAGEDSLVLKGAEGYPFDNAANPYSSSAKEMDILSDVMTKELAFHSMTASDALLSGHDAKTAWCLAEAGKQYLVFAIKGAKFSLELGAGAYTGKWIDTKSGEATAVPAVMATQGQKVAFSPPSVSTDWALVLKK